MIVDEAARIIDGMPVPAAVILTIDPAHSSIGFHVRHLMIAKVTGRFRTFSGTIHVEPDPEQSWAEVSIDAASIDTAEPKRDAHLRSPDFFDVEKFPNLTFKSTSVEDRGRGKLEIYGNLTIHGVTKEVVLETESLGQAKDPWGSERAGFTASTTVNRTDFGLGWNQVLEAGGLLVGEKIEIVLEIEAVRAAAVKAA